MRAQFGISPLTLANNEDIEQIQKRALKILVPGKSYKEAIAELNLELLSERRSEICKRFYNSALQPTSKLRELIPEQRQITYSLRHQRSFELFKSRTMRFKNSSIPACVKILDDHPF